MESSPLISARGYSYPVNSFHVIRLFISYISIVNIRTDILGAFQQRVVSYTTRMKDTTLARTAPSAFRWL